MLPRYQVQCKMQVCLIAREVTTQIKRLFSDLLALYVSLIATGSLAGRGA